MGNYCGRSIEEERKSILRALVPNVESTKFHSIYYWKDNHRELWAYLRIYVANNDIDFSVGRLRNDEFTEWFSLRAIWNAETLVLKSKNKNNHLRLYLSWGEQGIYGDLFLNQNYIFASPIAIIITDMVY